MLRLRRIVSEAGEPHRDNSKKGPLVTAT